MAEEGTEEVMVMVTRVLTVRNALCSIVLEINLIYYHQQEPEQEQEIEQHHQYNYNYNYNYIYTYNTNTDTNTNTNTTINNTYIGVTV